MCGCLCMSDVYTSYLSMLDSTMKSKFWRYVESWLCNLYDSDYDIVLFRHKQKNPYSFILEINKKFVFSKFKNVYMLYFVLFSNKRVAHIFTSVIHYAFLILNIIIKSDKNHVVSQMAHAKNIGEPFMTHAKKLYNIPCHDTCMMSCTMHLS